VHTFPRSAPTSDSWCSISCSLIPNERSMVSDQEDEHIMLSQPYSIDASSMLTLIQPCEVRGTSLISLLVSTSSSLGALVLRSQPGRISLSHPGGYSHQLDAQPRPRDHLQIILVRAAYRMLAAISCTQHIRPRVITSQVFD
jgi:hypothetical protein